MIGVNFLLENISEVLLHRILPQVESQYAKKSTSTIIFLINTAHDRYDNEAASKITESERLKKLFSMSLPVIKDDELRNKIEDALDKKEKSFRLRDINDFNQDLKGILIKLHTHLEMLQGNDVETIDEMIWKELADSTVEKNNSIIRLYMEHNAAISKESSV